jgi:IS30 family transposase
MTARKRNVHLTYAERKTIYHWIQKGESLREIARIINRGGNTVVREVRVNGGRYEYNPLEAQQTYKENIIKTNIKRSETVKEKSLSNPYMSLCNRIENLEMQLEIVANVLKELKGKYDSKD